VTPATARCLNLTGLGIGLLAALIITFVPPSVRRYTKEGAGIFHFTVDPTKTTKMLGRIQWLLSYLGPALLVVSFLLQFIALLALR
jgi:hypothetical protein